MNRHHFLRNSFIAGSTILLPSNTLLRAVGQSPQEEPQLDRELVKTCVGAAHRDLSLVKSMLEEHPTLLNAAHDWKYGDYETCLGAANHVGYKELVTLLIEKGAQANIFTTALFGRMEILKPYLDFFPSTIHAKGPHGYTLLHHANQGGEEALEVREYLMSLGAVETKIAIY
jgi:hypothetical protein